MFLAHFVGVCGSKVWRGIRRTPVRGEYREIAGVAAEGRVTQCSLSRHSSWERHDD
jgi:hypothetical protein